MNIDLTPVFQAIIALLAALVTYKLIPWIKSKTTDQQQANLMAAAKVAVFAAQQIYGATKEANEKKLEYALNRLRDSGFDLDTATLRAAIEKAVYELKPTTRFVDMVGNLDDEEDEAEDDGITPQDGDVIAPLEDWPLETIALFCEDNGINAEVCHTKDDYIRAITQGGLTEPPDAAEEPIKE